MGRVLAGFFAVLMVIFSLGTFDQGIKDAREAITRWKYYPLRDMRRTVVFVPNHVATIEPSAESVPTTGKDLDYGLQGIELANKLAAQLHNPTAPTDSSIARGERKFLHTCIPCHGTSMQGNGPVASMFMPPPDLLAEQTRQRADGYIYSYIRHGGVVMPSYGAQVTEEEAWNLINYIRHMQKVNPR